MTSRVFGLCTIPQLHHWVLYWNGVPPCSFGFWTIALSFEFNSLTMYNYKRQAKSCAYFHFFCFNHSRDLLILLIKIDFRTLPFDSKHTRTGKNTTTTLKKSPPQSKPKSIEKNWTNNFFFLYSLLFFRTDKKSIRYHSPTISNLLNGFKLKLV